MPFENTPAPRPMRSAALACLGLLLLRWLAARAQDRVPTTSRRQVAEDEIALRFMAGRYVDAR